MYDLSSNRIPRGEEIRALMVSSFTRRFHCWGSVAFCIHRLRIWAPLFRLAFVSKEPFLKAEQWRALHTRTQTEASTAVKHARLPKEGRLTNPSASCTFLRTCQSLPPRRHRKFGLMTIVSRSPNHCSFSRQGSGYPIRRSRKETLQSQRCTHSTYMMG